MNRWLLLIVGIVSWSIWYVDYSGVDPEIGVNRFGLLLCVSTVVYSAAPLLLVVWCNSVVPLTFDSCTVP